MKQLTVFIGALLLTISSFGQDVKVPSNYQLKKVEDYGPYKDSVEIVAKWMVSNPLTKDREVRGAANKFVLSWISGAPNTHIQINPEIANEVMKDKTNIYGTDLLMDYMAGMILVKLHNNEAEDPETQEAGIKAMLVGYESVVNFCTIKILDILQKQKAKGTLAEWIKANAAKSETKAKKE
ncbi:MAG: hypothetical protein Q8928_15005 [Bacteroidota bacterium]|nr:hypothetical protein [Bacteroidota bacterium]